LSVKNHSDLSNEITTDITNNGSELVTGLVLQSKLLDLADSAINILGDTVQGKLTYSSLFSISNTGDLTHKKYVDDSITSAVSAIDFTPYIKKDGSVLWTGDSDHNGHNIKNVSLISGVSGSEIDITAATDFTQGWLSVAPTYSALGFNNVGQVKVDNSGISIFSVVSGKIISLSTPGAVDIASSADNVNIESTTGDINLISHGYTAKLPSSAPGTNTYLKYDGTNYVWASASGGGTTTNSLSVDNSSLQLNSGTTFDGSAAKTISVKALGITNAMLAGSIAYSKLSLTGAILNADLAGGIDLTTKVTGLLPDSNIASAATWNAKQNALTFDSTPTASSSNPVTSDGIKTYTDKKSRIKAIIFG
jgi:hypothetical protein